MQDIDTSTIISIVAILLLSGFFSGMEIAFVSSSKFRFEMDREEQGFTAHLIDTFYRHPNNFISTLLVGNNIALVIYGILMAKLINTLILVPLGVHTEPDCPHEWICLLTQTLLGTLPVYPDHPCHDNRTRHGRVPAQDALQHQSQPHDAHLRPARLLLLYRAMAH